MATPTLPRNLRVYPGAPNNMEKPGIQRTLRIRTNKSQKTKTMETPTLSRNLRVYPGAPNTGETRDTENIVHNDKQNTES
jgi:hypothetical protein